LECLNVPNVPQPQTTAQQGAHAAWPGEIHLIQQLIWQ
jgi:hypothetical protein